MATSDRTLSNNIGSHLQEGVVTVINWTGIIACSFNTLSHSSPLTVQCAVIFVCKTDEASVNFSSKRKAL